MIFYFSFFSLMTIEILQVRFIFEFLIWARYRQAKKNSAKKLRVKEYYYMCIKKLYLLNMFGVVRLPRSP
jgi:hypothetical protein